jgi:hypothetical protein
MKEKLKKIAGVCKMIFGYGIMISVLAGGLTFLGYVAALIIGGDTAAMICDFIYKKIFTVLIYISTVMVLFGLLTMYLAGEFALTPNKKKASKEESER